MPFHRQCFAVAALSASLITLQVLLTRIFSVVFMSHLGFAAISLGMLGLSAAGVRIYLAYRDTTPEQVAAHVARHCFAAAALTLVCVFGLSRLGADVSAPDTRLYVSLAITYALCLGPFYASGLALSLLLTKSDGRAFGRLYACDLAGAGLGGLVALALLPLFGGPGAVLATSVAVAAVGIFVAPKGSTARWQCGMGLAACMLALGLDTAADTFHVRNPKGRADRVYTLQLMEKWNAFSRVAVYQSTMAPWSLGPKFKGDLPYSQRLDIDSSAATSIVHPSDPKHTTALSFELTSLAYFGAPHGNALVIGAGGGRDVLSALIFGQQHVDAVEINPIIVNDVMLGKFAELCANLYRDPRVTPHVQDGRSFVRGSDKHYDVIQLSLVDTWAATSAGAFALTENNLYTREAIADDIDHLTPDGILTFTRWSGFEVLRLLVEFEENCRARGITDFAKHIALVETRGFGRSNLTNVMFRRSPFDASTLQRIDAQIDHAGFTWLFDPRWDSPVNPVAKLLLSQEFTATADALLGAPLNSSTDDWPFFFLKPGGRLLEDLKADPISASAHPLYILIWVTLLALVSATTAIALPLLRSQSAAPQVRLAALSAAPYFALLGLGFMVFEVCLSQRFVLYLGHPTYALTVVLTSLLLGAGIGSFIASRTLERTTFTPTHLKLLAITTAIALLASSFIHATLFAHTAQLPFGGRVALAALSIMPVAALLGMCLPFGMSLLRARNETLVPWAWGINGFFSVVGSCVGALCAISFGFAFTAQLGAGLYALSALAVPGRDEAKARAVKISERQAAQQSLA